MASQTTTERPPEVENVRDYPELGRTGRPYVPARTLNTDYPVRYTYSKSPSLTRWTTFH